MREPNEGTQSIRRAVGLLRLIAREGRRGARLMALARTSELSAPTARRILKSLMDEGMVVQADHLGKYTLGPLVAELGLVEPFGSKRVMKWRPALSRICEESGCTTYLVQRSNLDTLIVDRVETRAYLRAVPYDVGQRYPLGIGAGSLALLASQPDEHVDRILQLNSQNYLRYEGVSVQRVRTLLKRTRKDGYAFAQVKRLRGICSVGIALPDPAGRPVLAIGIAVVGTDVEVRRREQLARLLKREVAVIEGAADANRKEVQHKKGQ